MVLVYLGTSGFSYDDWHGSFYESDVKPKDRLSRYVTRFPFLEVNYSYYRIPVAAHVRTMVEQTPDHFRFTFKCHRSLTHERTESDTELVSRAADFLDGLVPLRARASSLLIQFPYSFRYSTDNRRYLAGLARSLRTESARRDLALPLFVEFRNREWQRDSVRGGFREYELNPVLLDLPDLDRLPLAFCAEDVTPGAPLYVRFHGRNRDQWWTGDATSRYDYGYSEDELRQRADELVRLLRKNRPELVFVAFNNHFQGRAPANAQMLGRLLVDESTKVVAP